MRQRILSFCKTGELKYAAQMKKVIDIEFDSYRIGL